MTVPIIIINISRHFIINNLITIATTFIFTNSFALSINDNTIIFTVHYY